MRPYVFTDDCSTLSGTFYYDLNSDCIYDAGDSVIRYSDIFAVDLAAPTDTFWCGYTNDSGHYAINFPGGNYNVITDPNVYWGFYAPMSTMIPSCPASSVFALSVTAGATYSQNFGYTCNLPPSFDVIGDGSLIQPHPGDTAVLSIGIGNWWSYTGNLCSVISAFATLTLDPHLHYIGTAYSTPPTSVSGGILSWELNMWLIPGYFNTSIFVSVDTSVAIGDTLHNTVYISPITGIPDPDLTNNTALINSVVTAPFDPNGMSVCPEGAGIPGYIPYNSRLSYHVQFQNTGTAPAHTITIVDTLSNNVNMATLRILHPSAPVNMSISGNVVKFRFDNINLPDSADSPFGSIGMMDFGVMPKPGLPAGTQIWNKASIYFDYNAPVSTNSVLNTMDQRPLATPQINHANRTALVYPNPAGDEVLAKTSDNSDFTMTFVDMIGRTAATEKSANGKATANTQHLPTGLYIVNLTNAAGKVLTTKVTIQH